MLSRLLPLLILLCALAAPDRAAAGNLSAPDAYALLQGREDVYLLDVRSPQEFMQVRIEGARLIPIDQLQRRLDELPRDRPILVYCAIGSRSSMVTDYLARLGFASVHNLFGGVSAWQLRGYPVLRGRP